MLQQNLPQSRSPARRSARIAGRRPLAAILASLTPALAVYAGEEPPLGFITPNFRVLGELRGRAESVDFFKPALNSAKGVTAHQNDYAFGGVRTRLGLAMATPWVDGLVQGQYTGLYGLPEQAFAGAPVGPLGPGAAYYKDSGSPNPGQAFIKQGYLKLKLQPLIGLPNSFLQGGRFELMDGLEYKTGDPRFC